MTQKENKPETLCSGSR